MGGEEENGRRRGKKGRRVREKNMERERTEEYSIRYNIIYNI